MRSMTLCAGLLAGLALASWAEEPKGDLASLQGTWSGKVGPNNDLEASLTIKGADVELAITPPGDDEIKIKGEIKLDEKADPKRLDWIKFKLPSGDDLPETKALYRLEGDKLLICSGGPGTDRPAEFKADGEAQRIATWTRTKSKDKPAPTEPKGPK